jgi:hypothetical protein
MFIFDRSTMTPEQYSLSVQSQEANTQQESCSMKYSRIITSRIANRATNCTKAQNVYFQNRLIGRVYCRIV